MWDKEGKGRHQYQIQKIMKAKRVETGNRKEEIVLIRLRLGHCALNKTLQMVGNTCVVCVMNAMKKNQWGMLFYSVGNIRG